MPRQLLLASELAKELRVKVSTIQRWGRLRKIPTVRVSSNIVRYDLADVIAALKERGKVAEKPRRGKVS